MDNKSSMTALMSAFARAYHFKTAKKPVFADSAAEELMTENEYEGIEKYILSGIDFFAPELKGKFSDREALGYIVNTQLAPTPLARAIYCEDCLILIFNQPIDKFDSYNAATRRQAPLQGGKPCCGRFPRLAAFYLPPLSTERLKISMKTAATTGTEQYVIIGAGYDTFALREKDFVSEYPVFELDHPLTQADKLERIKRSGFSCNENVKFVPVDLSAEDMYGKLLEAGFDSNKKSFFSWLGVILIFNQPIDKSSAEIIPFVVKLPCKAASLAAVAFLDCDYFICRLCLQND